MVFQKMKRPQRDFVVEIKSSRRLAKSKSGSIWGSLDLKAHAAHVEGLLRTDDDGAATQGSIEVASASDSIRLSTLPLPAGTKPNDHQKFSVAPSAIQQKESGSEGSQEPANINEPNEASIGGKSQSRKARVAKMTKERQANDHDGLRTVRDEVEHGMLSSDDTGQILEPLATVVERYDPSDADKEVGGSSSKKNAKSSQRVAGVSRIAQKKETASESSPSRDESRDVGLAGACRNGSDKNIARSQENKKPLRDLNKGLSELEAENKHLKKLLADKLRKENTELMRKLGFS